MIGLGLIIPILSIATQPFMMPNLWVYQHGFNQTELILLTLALLAVFYTVKVLFLMYLSWKQPQFAYGVGVSLSQELLKNYLNQPYAFHLERNSAQLITNITSEVYQVVRFVLLCLMKSVSEGFILLGILCLMFYVEPIGVLFMGVFLSVICLLYQRSLRVRLLKLGSSRQYYEENRMQCIQQAFGSIKETMLLNRKEDFLKKHFQCVSEIAYSNQIYEMIDGIPRLALEWFAVIAMLILVSNRVFQGHSLVTLIPVLGFFAASAFKIIPSLTRVLINTQGFFYALPSLNRLYSELKLLNVSSPKNEKLDAIKLKSHIKIDRLSYCYPNSQNLVLNDISMEITCGSSVGLIGSTGSGKSTLIDLILGLLEPSTGRILVDGVDIQDNLVYWQKLIGYVPQSVYLTDDTIKRNIAFGLSDNEIDESAIWEAAKSAQLCDFILKLPQKLDTLVGERGVRLSGGQCQRIGIARALYHNPEILILDEATSALDLETEKEVMEAIQKLRGKKTIVIVTHRLSIVNYCDSIFKIERGLLKKY